MANNNQTRAEAVPANPCPRINNSRPGSSQRLVADVDPPNVQGGSERPEVPSPPLIGFDNAWVVELIEKDGPGILRLLWRLLGREQDVLDAYQDCFCRMAIRGRKGGVRSVRAYAYRIAANIAIELIRMRTRRQAHLPAVAEDQIRIGERREAAPEDADRIDELKAKIAELPTHLRQVVVLRDLNGMSYDDVSRILQIDPATARVYRRHAVVRLAGLLDAGSGSTQ